MASGRTRDLMPRELTGTEKLSVGRKLWLMHPYALLMGGGVLWAYGMVNYFAIIGLMVWTVLMMGARTTRDLAVGRSGGEVMTPSSALKAGVGIFGLMGLASVMAYFTGVANLDFLVLNGTWGFLSMMAVYQASKSDAQSGWMTGASAMAIPCTFFGVGVALRALQFSSAFLWPVKLVPLFCLGAIWQSWKYLSTRGRDRTKSSLKALAFASLATVCYLPATTFFWEFSWFEALIHLSLPMAAFSIPLWMSRDRMRQIAAAPPENEPKFLPGI